ncbi:MAG: superoxide dismutase [Cyclobacteriaceae bacterium]
MEKREFLKTSAAIGLGAGLSNTAFGGQIVNKMQDDPIVMYKDGKYVLPPLPYAYDALEPYIDEQTMRLHHDKHHQGYVNGLNKANKKIQESIGSGDFDVIQHWEREIAFNGAGHFLHSLFWHAMTPEKTKRSASLNEYINQAFYSFDNFKNYFIESTTKVAGSGWGILAYQRPADKLVILQVENHQKLSQWLVTPILMVDVWEHAYYLKYQNKRKEYLEAFFNVTNWDEVSRLLDRAKA